jgi:hypothetical protein
VIRKGEAWGTPVSGPAEAEGSGGDAALARLVAAHPGARLAFTPDAGSDLARAVGLTPGLSGREHRTTEVVLDALRGVDDGLAVNMIVLGVPPDRLHRWHRPRLVRVEVDGRAAYDGKATTVVIANGQHLRGNDVVPRGHPGDGRLEVHVYSLEGRERVEMRRRLPTGSHVPHPRITTTSGRTVKITSSRPLARETDSRKQGKVTDVTVTLIPAAYRLLI